MADFLVRSGGTSGGWTGTVYTTFAAAIAGGMAAGDRLIVSDAHSESTAAAVTLTFPGTAANPNQILVFTDAGGPLGTLSTGATVATTGANALTVAGNFYCRGVVFSAGSGASAANLIVAGTATNIQEFESCDLILGTSSGTSRLTLGSGGRAVITLKNSRLKLGATGQFVTLAAASAAKWLGGSIISGGTSPTSIFQSSGNLLVDGVDFSAFSSSFNLQSGSASLLTTGLFRNIKLPASWSGNVHSGAAAVGSRTQMINGDSANTNYRAWIDDYFGSIKSSTSVYVTADTDDGTTPLSYVMATNANNKWPATYLRSQEFFLWNEDTGTSKTITVELAYDGATALTNRDIWLDLYYLGDSGSPLGTDASTMGDPIASATTLTTSSTAWTGASGTGPNGSTTWSTQKIETSFTPQQKGPVVAVVCFALPSKSVYVDFPTALT